MKNKAENIERWYTEKALPSGWGYDEKVFFSLGLREDENYLEEAATILALMVSSGLTDLDKICQSGPTWRDIDTFERFWSFTEKREFDNSTPSGTPARDAFPVIVFCYHAMRHGAGKELSKVGKKWLKYHPEMR